MRRFVKGMVALALTGVLLLAGCGSAGGSNAEATKKKSVVINVSTMYAGSDSNYENFRVGVEAWMTETGFSANATYATADDAFKTRVLKDFQTGSEPDVLFYFNGADSNDLVAYNRVVSVDEIRAVYPEYASNMKTGMMQASPVDGKIYCVPVNGYWEGLFVNETVCKAAGVEVPGETTSWREFMTICQKIKDAGYTPIAASLASVPHYWFEFCIYNYQSAENHAIVPSAVDDIYGQAWVRGIEDIKYMYEQGFFPANTLSCSDDESFQLFVDGKAAFLLDGSWRAAAIEELVGDRVDDYVVTFVPGKGQRASTDIISGLSTGYFVTRKAWSDPDKREAAITFVEYMTTDEMVSKFAEVSATALVNGVQIDEDSLSKFMKSALDMAAAATGTAEAVQDYVPTSCRVPVFEGMPAIVKGEKSVRDAVDEVIRLYRVANGLEAEVEITDEEAALSSEIGE